MEAVLRVRLERLRCQTLRYGCLKNAAKIIEDGRIDEIKVARNAGWSQPMGKEILAGGKSLADMEAHALANGEPKKISGRQELLENLLNEFI